MIVLGIESTCDETAAAVVKDGHEVLSSLVLSQIDAHREFGGVVPEVAARSHIEAILPLIEQALSQAFNNSLRRGQSSTQDSAWKEVDAIAVANRPGLLGSILIGVLTAKTLALVKQKPLYGVDHVVAHTYANFLRGASGVRSQGLEKLKANSQHPTRSFPLLSLTVSGGHTQLVLFQHHDKYEILGKTRDDAVGEAFDKVAKLLGLPYPGGPAISMAAESGDKSAYSFPEAKLDQPYEFSFSGLKTAVLRHLQQLVGKDYTFPSFEIAPLLTRQQINNTAASFQQAAVDVLIKKTVAAYHEFKPKSVALAGGVAANTELRHQLATALPAQLMCPELEYCTDNAAMIAALGYFEAKSAGQLKQAQNPLMLEALPTK